MKRTDIVVLLDRSGSMQGRKADHEGGLRSFVEDQKSLAGDVRFTLIQFDSQEPCEVVYDAVPIADVKDIQLLPRGGTPLLDAVFKAAAHAEKSIPADSNVLFMVITDGEENGSHEVTKGAVQDRIKSLESKEWVFLYLGANVDAFAEGGRIGVAQACSAGYANTPQAVAALYDDLNGKVWSARAKSAHKRSLLRSDYEYSDADKEQLLSGNIVCSNAAVGKAEFLAATNTSSSGEQA